MANLRASQHAGPRAKIDVESYISGYFDGEGCFSVSISPRPGIRVGWEVRPSVSVSQNGDRGQVIELVSEYFGCGTIRPDRSDQTIKWETRRLGDIAGRVLPHFVRFPLLSAKQDDVDLLTTISQLMLAGDHRTRDGLLEIARMSSLMNPSGSRRYSLAQIEASAR
ncbi:MAG TPA: LAGLIDADG family homing endonuclease [Nitrospiraceae bacterium]